MVHENTVVALKPSAHRGSRRKPRVFIDFSLIGWRTHVTGIPRVAYTYLDEGYRLAARGAFDVFPVYVKEGALTDARPFLPRSNWRAFRARPGPRTAFQLLRSGAFFAAHTARILTVTLALPLLVVGKALFSFAFFNLWEAKLNEGFERLFFGLKRQVDRFFGKRLAHAPGDVLFMPAYWHDTPPREYAQLRSAGLTICPLVDDILPITHARHYRQGWRRQFKRFVFQILRESDHVYYVSDFTREAVRRVTQKEGVPLPPGSVMHHGREERPPTHAEGAHAPAVRKVLAVAQPFFLMVGSIEPKKKHLAVIAEFERLWQRGVRAHLVLVGKPGWKDRVIRNRFLIKSQLYASLHWLKDVADGDLWLLYRRAAAVIQASEAEGFGLPVLEALALGTKVLANDIPVFREIAGGHATFFDINREGALAQAVEAALAQGGSGEPALPWPTWTERADALYADLLRRSTHSPQSVEASPAAEALSA